MQLVELINEFYEFRNHSSKPNEVMVNCPFCMAQGHAAPDTNFKLGINVLEEKAHCHRCDWKALGERLFYQLAEEVNCNEVYSGNTEVKELKKKKRTVFKLKKVKLPKEFEPLWKDVNDKLSRRARQYLFDRGITTAEIRKYKIGFCAVGKYGGRIIIPLTYGKWVVGFAGRAFTKDLEPKYLINDGPDKGIFNYPRSGRRDRALIVEGQFDAINVARYIRSWDVLGLQGSALTELQCHMLAKYNTIAIWIDPDTAGLEGGERIVAKLKEETECKILGVPLFKGQTKDPGELSKKQILLAVKNISVWDSKFITKLHLRVAFSV